MHRFTNLSKGDFKSVYTGELQHKTMSPAMGKIRLTFLLCVAAKT